MGEPYRPLALVTGASTGIGYHLARQCAQNGFDLVVAADEPQIRDAAQDFRSAGAKLVEPVEADLAGPAGVDALWAAVAKTGRPLEALLANAGRGLGRGFLDQDFDEVRRVIDTNVTGTLYLVQKAARDMRARGSGRILFTGSIAGFVPGAFQAVYNGTKAFIDSFAYALREEMRDTGVSVSLLMPGATETAFFDRAGLKDTKIGTEKKDDPADVARVGFEAMMRGEADVVYGTRNKLQTAMADVTPPTMLAKAHRKQAEPGTAEKK